MKHLKTMTAVMMIAFGSSGLTSADTQTEAQMEQRLMQDMQQQQDMMKQEQKQYRNQNQKKAQHKQNPPVVEANEPMGSKGAMGGGSVVALKVAAQEKGAKLMQ